MSRVEEETVDLRIGDEAPDFTLQSHSEGELNLSWYRGRKAVVLAFYPGDWTPVCATQIPAYEPILSRIEALGCQLLAISCDSIPCHRAWAKSLGGISFPLMSDFWPHGEVCRRYGVFNQRGFSNRVVFVIDKAGVVRYIERLELGRIPDNETLLKFLSTLEQ